MIAVDYATEASSSKTFSSLSRWSLSRSFAFLFEFAENEKFKIQIFLTDLNVWMFIGDEKFHAWMGSSLFSHRARWTAKPSKQNSFSFRLRAEMCEASLDRTEIKSHKLCEKLGSVGLSLSLLQLMSCLLQFLLPFYVFFRFYFYGKSRRTWKRRFLNSFLLLFFWRPIDGLFVVMQSGAFNVTIEIHSACVRGDNKNKKWNCVNSFDCNRIGLHNSSLIEVHVDCELLCAKISSFRRRLHTATKRSLSIQRWHCDRHLTLPKCARETKRKAFHGRSAVFSPSATVGLMNMAKVHCSPSTV